VQVEKYGLDTSLCMQSDWISLSRVGVLTATLCKNVVENVSVCLCL